MKGTFPLRGLELAADCPTNIAKGNYWTTGSSAKGVVVSLDFEVQQKEAATTDHNRISLGKELRGKAERPASPGCSGWKCNLRTGGKGEGS